MERLEDVLRRLNLQGFDDPVADAVEADADPPRCPRCAGTGFFCYDVPRGHPDFGKVFPCECTAAELAERRRVRLERLSNLGALTRLTFDNLIADGRSPETPEHRRRFREAVTAARTFAIEAHGWLVLAGPPGCGKTHLAAAIANDCIARGEPALFVVVPDLLDHLRAAFNPSSEVAYDELFENVRTSPLLILDDLGTQSSTAWAMEKLFQLMNSRYNQRLATVVTTNQSLDDLDERMRVRLTDPDFCQVRHVQPPQSPALQRLGAALQLLHHMTFAQFDPDGACKDERQRDSLEAAFAAAQDFAGQAEGWLVLQGAPGCGKTHLAAAIANARLAMNQPPTFLSVPDLLDHLRSTYGPDSRVTYDDLFATIRTAPLLILDDLGTQSATAWAQEKLYQLFNYRYNARLATVVTTNTHLRELDPRLASRLGDQNFSRYCVIEAPDFRRPPTPASGPNSGNRPRYPRRDNSRPH